METYTVVSNEEYLKSLNITPVHFNFNDQEQLRMHLLSAMICSSTQDNGEGYIDFAITDENLREISGGCLDLDTIGLAAAEGDTVEARKIARNPVSWQLVRNRYEKMVSKVDSRDKDLLNKYKCYGLNFAEPFLTRELVKELTGRYTITKALNQAVFRRIQCLVSSGVVMVGFGENANPVTLKSDTSSTNLISRCVDTKQLIALG
uniref:Replication initiation protein n=1 Tax=Angiostrongylus cantonensis TaxID=6313 RepID=A0A0K0D107_ANGCA